MATVEQNLQAIKNAVYGKDVRVAIHDSIESMNNKLNNSDPVAVAERLDNDTMPLALANNRSIGYGIDGRLLKENIIINFGNSISIREDINALRDKNDPDKYNKIRTYENDNSVVKYIYDGSKFKVDYKLKPEKTGGTSWLITLCPDVEYCKNNGIDSIYIGVTLAFKDHTALIRNLDNLKYYSRNSLSKIADNWNSIASYDFKIELIRTVPTGYNTLFCLYKFLPTYNPVVLNDYKYLICGYKYAYYIVGCSIDFIMDGKSYDAIKNEIPNSTMLHGNAIPVPTDMIGFRIDNDNQRFNLSLYSTKFDNGFFQRNGFNSSKLSENIYGNGLSRRLVYVKIEDPKIALRPESIKRYLVVTDLSFDIPKIVSSDGYGSTISTFPNGFPNGNLSSDRGGNAIVVFGHDPGDWGPSENPLYTKHIILNSLIANDVYGRTKVFTQPNGKYTLIIDLLTAYNTYKEIVNNGDDLDAFYVQFGTFYSGSQEEMADRRYWIEGYLYFANNIYEDFNVTNLFELWNSNNDNNEEYKNEIVCWGDSLTAGGGWMNVLSSKSGLPFVNCGVGGENANTIMARQGSDPFVLNNITIPAANGSSVEIAKRSVSTMKTQFGYSVTPGLQGFGGMNPVTIEGFDNGKVIKGNIQWTGSGYADMNGVWNFVRSEADPDGQAITLDRPHALTTASDKDHNNPYLMIVFIGQNGGYGGWEDLVNKNRQMIEHARPKHYLVLGLSSGTAAERSEYESLMRKEFGRYFISLREYLAHPIYNSNNQIISCYGLEDQGLTPNSGTNAGGIAYNSLNDITEGRVPRQILQDSGHYTNGTKNVIGNMLWRKCRELKIF